MHQPLAHRGFIGYTGSINQRGETVDQEAKLAILAHIAQALNDAGVVWGLGASAMLYYEGVTDAFEDFDLLIAQGSLPTAQQALEELGAIPSPPAAPSSTYATAHFQEYTWQGVELDLLCGFAVRRKEGVFSFPFDATRIARHAEQRGVPIPLCSLADWFVLYLLMPGRAKKALLIAQHWKVQRTAEPRAWLNLWLRNRLPGDVRERVMALYAELGNLQ